MTKNQRKKTFKKIQKINQKEKIEYYVFANKKRKNSLKKQNIY